MVGSADRSCGQRRIDGDYHTVSDYDGKPIENNVVRGQFGDCPRFHFRLCNGHRHLYLHQTNRRGEEHGSAKWGIVERINKKYRAKEPKPNKILTQNIRIGLNGKKHRRNLNTVVVGGSGAGKTRFYAKPCIYESITAGKDGEFCSFVCLDPKGELLRDSGNLLKECGYIPAAIPM